MSDSNALPHPTRRNWVWRFIQFWFQIFVMLWFGLKTRGKEKLPEGGALFLVNHQSYLDPLLISVWLRRPVSFLARDNLFSVPVVGWVLKNTYVMPIKRESASTESLRKSVERLNHGFYVGLFPEGTRTRTGEIGSFKPGFVAIVRRADVPVIPVGISGALQAFPRTSSWIKPTRIRVVYGDPLPAELVQELCERGRESDFANEVRQRVEQCAQEAEAWRIGIENQNGPAVVE